MYGGVRDHDDDGDGGVGMAGDIIAHRTDQLSWRR